MIKVTVDPSDAINGLNNVVGSMDRNIESVLDSMAGETKEKMSSEAPVASGALSQSIVVQSKPSWRMIFASLLYGSALERRDNVPQQRPPVEKLRRWAEVKGFADPRRAAHALARTIAMKGYKANKFVLRTFIWLQTTLDKWANMLGTKIEASYSG